MLGVSPAVLQRGMSTYRRPSRPTPSEPALYTSEYSSEVTRKPLVLGLQRIVQRQGFHCIREADRKSSDFGSHVGDFSNELVAQLRADRTKADFQVMYRWTTMRAVMTKFQFGDRVNRIGALVPQYMRNGVVVRVIPDTEGEDLFNEYEVDFGNQLILTLYETQLQLASTDPNEFAKA